MTVRLRIPDDTQWRKEVDGAASEKDNGIGRIKKLRRSWFFYEAGRWPLLLMFNLLIR